MERGMDLAFCFHVFEIMFLMYNLLLIWLNGVSKCRLMHKSFVIIQINDWCISLVKNSMN